MSSLELPFGPSIFERTLSSSERSDIQSSSLSSQPVSSPLEQLSDTELVHKLRDNSSPDCLAVLFARYRSLILSICVKILRDGYEAEDVSQDVILEIWSKADQFDENRGTVKVWIVQFAYSKSLHRRRHLAARHYQSQDENGNGNGPGYVDNLELSYIPEHVERLTTEKQILQMKNAFASLNPKQQKALQLIYFEGLSIREVAEQTNESVENTRHHYYRGVKKLKELLSTSPNGKAR